MKFPVRSLTSFLFVIGLLFYVGECFQGINLGARGVLRSPILPNEANCITVWNRTWGNETTEIGNEIALDSNGNIFLGGMSGGSSFVSKFNPEGTQLWNVSELAGFGGLAVDEGGNVTLAGRVGDMTYWDLFLARYDQSGAKLWSVTWDGGGMKTIPQSVAVDSLGNAYVAGMNYSNYEAPCYDSFIVKFDTINEEAWNITWRGDEVDFLESIALDEGSDAIYVVGTTGAWAAQGHPLLAKFNLTTGVLVWDRVLSVEEDGDCVYVDAEGSVYVAGPGYLAKYDAGGTQAWNRTWDNNYADCGIAVNGNHEIFVTNNPLLLRYNSSGTLLDQVSINELDFGEGRHLAINDKGFLFLVGNRGIYDTGAVDAVIYKGEYHSPPAAPFLYPIPSDEATNRTIRLAWTSVAGATSYRVCSCQTGTLEGMGIHIFPYAVLESSTTGTTCEISWPANEAGVVYFVVVAVNASGTSIASNCQVTDLAPPPFDPLQFLGPVLLVGAPAAAVIVGVVWIRRRRLKRKL